MKTIILLNVIWNLLYSLKSLYNFRVFYNIILVYVTDPDILRDILFTDSFIADNVYQEKFFET